MKMDLMSEDMKKQHK
jgi:hypothetical protein